VVTDADMDKATLCRRRMLGWIISLTVSFSGIDAIYYYSNNIYEEAGLSEYATSITGKSNYYLNFQKIKEKKKKSDLKKNSKFCLLLLKSLNEYILIFLFRN
jgi:hypothetical protein